MSADAIKRVCFVGIGNMGWPMAARLVRAGFAVAVADAVAGRAKAFVGEVGGTAGASLAEATKEADVLLTRPLATSDQREDDYVTDAHRKHGELIARAWSDEAFMARLKTDPKAAMKEVGIDVPDGVTFEVREDTASKRSLVLPRKRGGELSDTALDGVAGGYFKPPTCHF